jgi:predicted 3-demethylubiquinone-9 3-methyltransferase (glyoxalase superfamily)
MNKITPFLWFDDNAEDAAEFYLSVFPEAKKVTELRSSGWDPGQPERSRPLPSNLWVNR